MPHPPTRPHTRLPLRRAAVAPLLVCTLTLGAVACEPSAMNGGSGTTAPDGTGAAQHQNLAKVRFVTNAGLAAGATYQWIIEPYQAGKFDKDANGRTLALVKAGLAGVFTYNRLRAAVHNAQGDPELAKAVAPLSHRIESLKNLGGRLSKGEVNAGDIGTFQNVINEVKGAGWSVGAMLTDKVPSAAQLKVKG
ncbi:hypothetical protein ACWC2K_00545 [Streptomyces chattanoogensis]